MRIITSLLAAIGIAIATPAAAEVEAVGDGGFIVTGSAQVAGAPADVWSALVDPARYWHADHSWSGDAANMTLEPRAGGCFCEALPDGGSAEHMRVVNIPPCKMLEMRGLLGPLQGEALTGVLVVRLEPFVGGTGILWRYTVGGYAQFPLSEIAPAVDGVIGQQMMRLADLFDG